MRLFWHQVRAEQLQFWRSRESAFFVFAFPMLLFVLLGSVYTGRIDHHPADEVLLAGLLGYGAANTAFVGLAIGLVADRELGILKRLRATPLPSTTYMAALLGSTLLVFALQSVLLFALGRVLYGSKLPGNLLSLGLALLVSAAAFATLGIAAASLIQSLEGSSAVLNFILLPMAFLSGSFGPTRHYPGFLRAVGDVLPLKYTLRLVNATYLVGNRIWSRPGALGVLALWSVVAVGIAVRRFTWEPRRQ
jgi:ABC-2 type transport system permease protein